MRTYLGRPSFSMRFMTLAAIAARFFAALLSRHRRRLGPTAQCGMVRDDEVQAEQADYGADQSFGLAQSQADAYTAWRALKQAPAGAP